jgi:hypothetical protein
MSTFEELSQLISVSDICESFIGEFDNSQSMSNVWEEWSVDLCDEKDLDPMEQFALVKSNQKIVGWIGYEDLDPSKTLCECMEPIRGDILISSDTPLLEAIRVVCRSNDFIFLVLKGNRFVGWLHYDHFYKLPFRMCLFSLLIDLEEMLLKIAKSDSISFLEKLPDTRLDKAKEIYKYRQYSLNKEGKEFDSKLIECTAFCDKFIMLRKNAAIVQEFPSINSKFGDKAEDIRNDIAHPKAEKSGALPLKKEKLILFIEWAGKLRQQINDYINQTGSVILK